MQGLFSFSLLLLLVASQLLSWSALICGARG